MGEDGFYTMDKMLVKCLLRRISTVRYLIRFSVIFSSLSCQKSVAEMRALLVGVLFVGVVAGLPPATIPYGEF